MNTIIIALLCILIVLMIILNIRLFSQKNSQPENTENYIKLLGDVICENQKNIGKMQKQEESHIVCIMNQSYFAPVHHRINNTGKSYEANRIFPE